MPVWSFFIRSQPYIFLIMLSSVIKRCGREARGNPLRGAWACCGVPGKKEENAKRKMISPGLEPGTLSVLN